MASVHSVNWLFAAAALGWSFVVGCGTLGYGGSGSGAGDDDTYGDPAEAPVISDLGFAPDYTAWALTGTMAWTDPQRNIAQGLVHIEVDGRVLTEMPIPSDTVDVDDEWIRFDIGLEDLDWGSEHLFAVRLIDATGNWSAPAELPYAMPGSDAYEIEPNNDAGGAMQLGSVTLPLAVRAEITSVGTHGDEDWFEFVPMEGGAVTLRVYWGPTEADYDVQLADTAGNLIAAGSTRAGSPEQASGTISAGVAYRLVVIGVSGPAASYSAVLSR